jgi:hypothetical protein
VPPALSDVRARKLRLLSDSLLRFDGSVTDEMSGLRALALGEVLLQFAGGEQALATALGST